MNFLTGSWKTTSAGVLIIVGAVTHLIFNWKTISESDVMTAATAALAGLGLLASRDHSVSDEQAGAGQTPSFPPKAAGLLALALVASFALTGCDRPSKERQNVESEEQKFNDQAQANDDAQFDAHEKSLKNARYKLITAELDASLTNAKAQAVVNPKLDIVAETSRLYALAQQRRSDFDKAQADFRALHEKNIATNRASAQRARDFLKTPRPAPVVDTTKQTQAVTGTPPPQATLIEPGN